MSRHSWVLMALGLAVSLAMPTAALHATTIYFDDFSGSASTDLNGRTTTIGSGTWVAQTWKANGSISNASSSNADAYLPFTPVAGNIYSLSLTVDPTSGGDDWFGLGFSSSNDPSGFFAATASPWMLERAGGGASGYQTQMFPVGVGSASTDGPKNLKAVLDTTTALWGVKYYRDDVLLATYTYTSNPTITSVGFGRIGVVVGTVDNFELAIVPEPSSVAMLVGGVIGVAGILWKHRRSPHSAG